MLLITLTSAGLMADWGVCAGGEVIKEGLDGSHPDAPVTITDVCRRHCKNYCNEQMKAKRLLDRVTGTKGARRVLLCSMS